VPVPLSRKRHFERGHNQADVIAHTIADLTRFPVIANALQRVDSSPIHRVGMDKKAREATVKNSFAVNTPRLIDGTDVLLVDDVFTSGSTASYCARVLKKNGATSVKVITLARAVLYS
jgi:ComF family protein